MKRDTFWDSLKFLLIFFVVYGHMMETYAPDGSYHRSMYNFIYAFHMPFFMFISGRFSQIQNRKKYWNSNVKLFETYFIFQAIRCLKDIYLNGHIDIVEGILFPKGTLWYIAYLILYRIIVYTLPLDFWKKHISIILSISIGLAILWGFIPYATGQRFLVYLSYFFMGFLSFHVNFKYICQRIPLYLAFALLLTIVFIFFIHIDFNICYIIYYNATYYRTDPYIPAAILCMARCGSYLVFTITSILLMRIILAWGCFPKYGRKTLFIYMYHTFFVLSLRLLIARGYIPENEVLLFIYSIAIILVLVHLSNVKFFTILMNPFSSFYDKYIR